MRELIIVSTAIAIVLGVIVAALPWLLAKRGVIMRRTRFGVTLIFESADADGTPVRLLNVNGTYQSVTYLPERYRYELACVYHRAMAETIESLEGNLRVMVMGGGGYSLPKYLATFVPATRTTVVEVDPKITQIARELFFLDECLERTGAGRDGRLTLVNDDAWAWLQRQDEPFDVLVNDAFSGSRPLGPMGTAEGAHVVREHLSERGVYLANVRCPTEGRRARPLREAEKAFGGVFSHVALVPEWPDDPTRAGNNTLVCSDAEVRLPEGAIVVQ